MIFLVCFNTIFNYISAISWRPVLVVEEAGDPRGEPSAMGKQLLNFITAAASRVHPFCNLQSQAWTHIVLVTGLYELLDPAT
jgi:hypothetical protein